MKRRIWVRSGVTEELDQRQQRLLDLVYDRIVFYYRELYQTRPCYQHPLCLSRLMKLCSRNSYAVISAVRLLANSVAEGEHEPRVIYDRISSEKNASHRPYRIFLRSHSRAES